MMQRGEIHLIKIFFMSFIFLFLHCGLFEPERKTGSLQIVLVKEAGEASLEKAAGTLTSVQCIVKKGTETKYDGNLTKQGSTFHGEITDLQPGSDYSVLLYGKNSGSEMIARANQTGISVKAGEQSTASLSWSGFIPALSTPTNGSTTSDNTPAFDWSNVGGAVSYELIVDNSSSFNSPEIDQTSLSVSSYTATSSLSDGTYYWRVRCKDSLGNWGGWSEVWNLTINLSASNMIAFYPFNGNANDESGNGNNGIVYGASITYDRFGNSGRAYYFNGSSAYIEVQDNDFADITGSFTISLWIFPESNYGWLINKHKRAINDDGSWELVLGSTNYIGFDCTPFMSTNILSVTPITQNVWHHITVLFNRTDAYFQMYIDDIKNIGIKRNLDIRNTSNKLYFGVQEDNPFGVGNYYKGKIDDIRIYNYSLNDTEIQQLYHEGGW